MLIHYLEFNNFLPFCGVHRLDFPTKQNTEQPFTLILSPTNTGKTTTIRALRYLLYGSFRNEPIGVAHTLINHEAKRRCPDGKRVECWVRAKITLGPNNEFWFQRRIVAARTGEGMDGFQVRESVFEKIRTYRGETIAEEDNGEIARAIKRYAPDLLFNLFIFTGEPGEGRIDPTRQNTGLEDELREIFRLHAWDRARQQLGTVRKSLVDEIANQQLNAVEVQTAWNSYQRTKAAAQQFKEQIVTANDRKASLAAEIEAGEDDLSKIGPKGEQAEQLDKEHQDAKAALKQAQLKRDQCRAEILEKISSSRGRVWMTRVLESVSQKLPPRETAPPSVPLATLRQLLDDERCICGRSLDSDCAIERDEIDRLVSRLQGANGEGRLSLLRKHLSPSCEWRTHSNQAAEFVSVRLEQLDNFALSHADLEKKVEDCVSKIDEASIEAARSARIRLSVLKGEMETTIRKLSNAEASLEAQRNTVQTAKRNYEARRQSLPRQQQELAERTEKSIALVDRLIELIETTKADLQRYLRQGLQDKLSQNYDEAATDGSRAKIGATLSPQIELNGVRVTDIGGAQKQMLELGYVVALAEVYHEISLAFKEQGLNLNASPDLAIVADAPFAHAADTFNAKMVDFLSRCSARQIILLMHKTQWEAVKEKVAPLVSTVFGYRLHSPNPPDNRSEYEVTIKGNEISLLRAANEENPPTSEILKVYPNANQTA